MKEKFDEYKEQWRLNLIRNGLTDQTLIDLDPFLIPLQLVDFALRELDVNFIQVTEI